MIRTAIIALLLAIAANEYLLRADMQAQLELREKELEIARNELAIRRASERSCILTPKNKPLWTLIQEHLDGKFEQN